MVKDVGLKFDEMKYYRDKDGFINLNAFLTNVYLEKEIRGNEHRQKKWFGTKDGRVMFKSNTEEQQFSHYSELIACKLAKQAEIETAQYDLAKYNSEFGIVTKDVCKDGEELVTLHELIGDPPTNEEYPDSTDIYYVFEKLEEKLFKDKYDYSEIMSCIENLKKYYLFDLYIMETDDHTQNISFVISKNIKTGKPSIRISPKYDTEQAFALYLDKEYMKKISSDILKTSEITNLQEPKVCVIPEEEQKLNEPINPLSFLEKLRSDVNYDNYYGTKSEEIWKTTLDYLSLDYKSNRFIEDKLEKLDIVKAIKDVEEDIKCEIPVEVKNMAINCFQDRKEAIRYELSLDLEVPDSTIGEEYKKCEKCNDFEEK